MSKEQLCVYEPDDGKHEWIEAVVDHMSQMSQGYLIMMGRSSFNATKPDENRPHYIGITFETTASDPKQGRYAYSIHNPQSKLTKFKLDYFKVFVAKKSSFLDKTSTLSFFDLQRLINEAIILSQAPRHHREKLIKFAANRSSFAQFTTPSPDMDEDINDEPSENEGSYEPPEGENEEPYQGLEDFFPKKSTTSPLHRNGTDSTEDDGSQSTKSPVKIPVSVHAQRMPLPHVKATDERYPLPLEGLLFGFLPLFMWFTYRVVQEKAEHVRDMMKISGLEDCVFWFSHFLDAILLFLIIVPIICCIFVVQVVKYPVLETGSIPVFFTTIMLWAIAMLWYDFNLFSSSLSEHHAGAS
jgi:ABC-2 family transporter protein